MGDLHRKLLNFFPKFSRSSASNENDLWLEWCRGVTELVQASILAPGD